MFISWGCLDLSDDTNCTSKLGLSPSLVVLGFTVFSHSKDWDANGGDWQWYINTVRSPLVLSNSRRASSSTGSEYSRNVRQRDWAQIWTTQISIWSSFLHAGDDNPCTSFLATKQNGDNGKDLKKLDYTLAQPVKRAYFGFVIIPTPKCKSRAWGLRCWRNYWSTHVGCMVYFHRWSCPWKYD